LKKLRAIFDKLADHAAIEALLSVSDNEKCIFDMEAFKKNVY
jgi:hypothetical protein